MITRKKVINALLDMGIPAGIKGIDYIADAIELMQENEWRHGKITVLYYKIGEKYNATASGVERGIRTTFNAALRNKSPEELKKYIGMQKPTNGNLLYALYYKLQEDE